MSAATLVQPRDSMSCQRPRKKPDRSHQTRILCVDDDHDLTRLIKARLQNFDVGVTRASNGRDGLKRARSHRPDVIVTDLSMDKGDGEYLIRKLQSRPSTASIPIAVISGQDTERLMRANLLGADIVLQKPVRFDVLIDYLTPFLMSPQRPPAHEASVESNTRPTDVSLRKPSRKRHFRLDQAHPVSGPHSISQ